MVSGGGDGVVEGQVLQQPLLQSRYRSVSVVMGEHAQGQEEEEDTQQQQQEKTLHYRVYPYRWIILGLYCLLGALRVTGAVSVCLRLRLFPCVHVGVHMGVCVGVGVCPCLCPCHLVSASSLTPPEQISHNRYGSELGTRSWHDLTLFFLCLSPQVGAVDQMSLRICHWD